MEKKGIVPSYGPFFVALVQALAFQLTTPRPLFRFAGAIVKVAAPGVRTCSRIGPVDSNAAFRA